MIQQAAARLARLNGIQAPIVVCNQLHVASIVSQLDEVGAAPALVVAEPRGRHTAAAIAAAALATSEEETVLAILPADHVIADEQALRAAMAVAVTSASEGAVVTFGIVPKRAETGYGYIEAAERAGGGPRRIVSFVEKPDAATASRFLDGHHFWNSGMFVLRADVALAELRRFEPKLVDAVEAALRIPVDGIITLGSEFIDAPAIPFDVAVMERTERAVMVPLDAGWDDIGSWRSLWEAAERDRDENAVVGDVLGVDTHRSYLRSDGRPMVVLGLDDVVVVDAGDVVFVASMGRAQDVRDLVARLDTERPDLT